MMMMMMPDAAETEADARSITISITVPRIITIA